MFLHLPLFRKVGVSVRADFKQLQNDCRMHHDAALDEPFAGHIGPEVPSSDVEGQGLGPQAHLAQPYISPARPGPMSGLTRAAG